MYLLDTNIFLEIVLKQEKSEVCKQFLKNYSQEIFISDFSFHSIGIIFFRSKKYKLFNEFINDIIKNIHVLSFPSYEFKSFTQSATKLNLDFDDFYQYKVAKHYNLQIVTMDHDFKKVNDLKVLFL